jgi:hypothetical protein
VGLILTPQVWINLHRSATCAIPVHAAWHYHRYSPGSVTLQHNFASDATLTDQATIKYIKNAQERFFLNLKGQGPLNKIKNIQRLDRKS